MCVIGFCNMWVCVCVGFVKCGCVHMWVLYSVGACICGFCIVWERVYVGFVMWECMCGLCKVWLFGFFIVWIL